MRSKLNKLKQRFQAKGKSLLPFGLVLLLLLIGQFFSPGFFSLSHLTHILTLAAPLGIMAIGQTFVILSGKEDVDFSSGANASLSIVLTAFLLQRYNHGITILIILTVGFIFGLMNGFGVRVIGIPPLIMTFCSSMLLYGVGQAITRGMSIGTSTPVLTFMALGRIAGIPVAFLIWMGSTILAALVLHATIYGRWLYAAGSNPMATHLAGISNKVVGMVAYALSGTLSAFAGLLFLGRFSIPSGFRMAEIYTLPCIMAVILGGTNFFGGEGGFTGSIGSVIALTILDSFFTIFNISQAWRTVMYGLLLVIILIFFVRREKLRI